MPTVDALLDREYKDDYQCAHFVREAYKHLYNEELPPEFESFILPPGQRTVTRSIKNSFSVVRNPSNRCIGIFRKVRGRPHVGLWHKGSILNLASSGVQYVPLHVVMLRFKSVQFYKADHHGKNSVFRDR